MLLSGKQELDAQSQEPEIAKEERFKQVTRPSLAIAKEEKVMMRQGQRGRDGAHELFQEDLIHISAQRAEAGHFGRGARQKEDFGRQINAHKVIAIDQRICD